MADDVSTNGSAADKCGAMRALLAILVAFGLLISPATAAAAAVACAHMDVQAMAAMSMDDQVGVSVDLEAHSCCDEKTNPPQTDETCAQTCAVMCVVVAALPAQVAVWTAPKHAATEPERPLEPRGHTPPSVRRPPRTIV